MLFAGMMVVDASTIIEEGAVVVDSNRIVAVGAHTDLTDRYPNHERREFDIVAPGLAGGYVHPVQSLGRGIADGTELLDWLFDHILPMEAGLDTEGTRVTVEFDYLECVESGATMVVDHLLVRHAEEAFKTAGEMGIRGRVGKVFTDTNTPERFQEDTDAGLARSERLIERYHGSFDGCIQCAVASRFTVTCSKACLQGARDLASRYDGIRIHTHASEDRGKTKTVEDETGMRSIHQFDEVGLTGDDVVLAHCVHIDDSERDALAETSTHVTYCPLSNTELVLGITSIPDYLDRGINVTLDNDGPPYNSMLDSSTEVRRTSLLQKVDTLDLTGAPAMTVFETATRSGTKAVGFDRVGELCEGWKAGTVGIDADHTRTASLHDVLPRLVFVAHGDDVVFIMINGGVLYDEGEHVRADADGIRKRAQAVADGLDSVPMNDWTVFPPARPLRTRDRPAASARLAAIVAFFSPRDAT